VAAVREAVGVAAYAAGDYAEAARELRAYRRMSGDEGYRAVLADCERALRRPEVALRLVAEALASSPDADEVSELRLVEAGARRDLGEQAAARLVLEAALAAGVSGARIDPSTVTAEDPGRLRLASAYADLLADEGETELSVEWLTAIAAADPDDAVGALARLGIEFTDTEVVDAEDANTEDPETEDAAVVEAVDDEVLPAELDAAQGEAPDQVEYVPDPAGFDAEVAAEVAELLGEDDASTEGPDDESSTQD
jgi:hypothetical protein